MKKVEQIEEELKKHKNWLKENKLNSDKKDTYLHECVVETLEWVLDIKNKKN